MDKTLSVNQRERQIATRREQILIASARLFAEKGFHRATTKEIAEAAEVSEGTLYNYFESKEELLLGIMSLLADSQELEARLTESLPLDARDFLLAMLRYRWDFAEENASMLKAILSEILADASLRQQYLQKLLVPALSLLERHLQTRIDLGHIRSINAPLAARILVGMTLGLFVLQVLGDPMIQLKWDDLTELMTSIVFEGVMP